VNENKIPHFSYLTYAYSVMHKKTSKKSQYYRETYDLSNIGYHSQLGQSYDLAKLGNYDELIDRLRKYDHEYLALNNSVADFTIAYFMEYIPNDLLVIEPEVAFTVMNKKSSSVLVENFLV